MLKLTGVYPAVWCVGRGYVCQYVVNEIYTRYSESTDVTHVYGVCEESVSVIVEYCEQESNHTQSMDD